ncbi:ras-like GTP-binding protein rhoA [Littorina saxatilis]|uniref:Uncharacterized protein n=1 Tax=Littorina saxatilis TaxID=31220 RepID=A0AAN9BCJ5_9CAEN
MESIRKRLLVCGDNECGKTALRRVFVKGEPADNGFVPICGLPTQVIETDFNETQVDVVLVETDGPQVVSKLAQRAYEDSDVIVICFAIDDPDSLENVEFIWYHIVCRFRRSGVPIILVGNKKDLRNDPATLRKLEQMRESPVSCEEGRAMAEKIGAAAYLECSARTNDGVREVLEAAIRSTLRKPPGQFGLLCVFVFRVLQFFFR